MPLKGEIAAGVTRRLYVQCGAADYLGAAVTRQGAVNIAILAPDGVLLRRFRSPGVDGVRRIGFAAEAAGRYTIELTNPSSNAAGFEIRLDRITSLDERLTPAPPTEPYPSPAIAALRKEIASDPPGATGRFWKTIARDGSPLVEPYGSGGKYHLVTFLWRGDSTTRNVVVVGPDWGSLRPADNTMSNIPSSGIWYLTRRLPSGARFDYRLSVNDPLTSDEKASAIRRSTVRADPLNPRKGECEPGAARDECRSVVELPGAPPQPWLIKQPGRPEGRVERHTIHSAIQKLDRTIHIYTPPGYRRDGAPNHLLVLFDGPAYLSEYSLPTTMDNLIAAGKIPPTVVAMVSNVADRRLTDLVANPEFADFVATELTDWVGARYNVAANPSQRAVGGFSAGGLAAAYMGLRHSGVFGNVLSQSGAFWWAPDHYRDRDPTTETNWMVKQFLSSPKLPVRFHLEAGTFEADLAGEGGDILESTRHLRDVLLAKGYFVHYLQFIGGHDGLSWRGTLADALIALFEKP